MAAPNDTDKPSPPDGQGKPSGGNADGVTPKMITEEEFERRIRGKAAEAERAAKALEAAQAKLAKIEADAKTREEAALSEQGKHKELAEVRSAEAKQLREQLKAKEEEVAALRAEKQARDDAVRAANKEQIKALKDDDRRKKLMAKLDTLDGETLAEWIADAKALESDDGINGAGVYGGGPRPKTGGSPGNSVESANQAFSNALWQRPARGGR